MRHGFWLTGIVLLGAAGGWAANYVTDGADAGRTGWVKDEKVFNKTNVKNMKLLWKTKLPSRERASSPRTMGSV